MYQQDQQDQTDSRHVPYAKLLTRHYVRDWASEPGAGIKGDLYDRVNCTSADLSLMLSEMDEVRPSVHPQHRHLLEKILRVDPPSPVGFNGVRPRELVLSFLANRLLPTVADEWDEITKGNLTLERARFFLEEAAKPETRHATEGHLVATWLLEDHHDLLHEMADEAHREAAQTSPWLPAA